jgi:hypothetical protein
MVHFLVDRSPNVMRALIFFSYIVIALTITTIIVWDLWRLYRARSESIQRKPKRERSSSLALKCQGTLALLSFVTLSYHMLSFLVVSYIQWSDKRRHRLLDPSSRILYCSDLQSGNGQPRPPYSKTSGKPSATSPGVIGGRRRHSCIPSSGTDTWRTLVRISSSSPCTFLHH